MNREKNSPQSLRVFFSICLSKAAHEAVVKLLVGLRKKITDTNVRWTQADHLHITLKFIGSIEPAKLQQLLAVLPEHLHSIKPFEIELGNVYAFPPARPHCIALAIKRSKPLAALAETINTVCTMQGFEPERRAFLPHITLARVKGAKFPDLSDPSKTLLPSFEADTVTLFKSEPTELGSHYAELHRLRLGD